MNPTILFGSYQHPCKTEQTKYLKESDVLPSGSLALHGPFAVQTELPVPGAGDCR